MKKLSLIAIVMVLLASCTKVTLDNKYVEESAEKDLAALVKNKTITGEEKTLITDYISNKEIVTEDELTYSSILEKAKENKARKERNEVLQKELDQKLSVVFIKKYYYSNSDGEYISLDAKVTNNTDVNINGFSLGATIKDGAGNELDRGSWNDGNTVVKAKSSQVSERFLLDYDNSDDKLVKLRAADLDKLQIEYHVISIIFADGSSLSLEEED